MKKIFFYALLPLFFFQFFNCSKSTTITAPAKVEFTDPRQVTILGYNGNAMEPYISRDGSVLFFNNLNQPKLPDGRVNDTNIYYAKRIDALTFRFAGPVIGACTDSLANTNELEAVPSMDKYHVFYFINTINYLNQNSPDYLRSIFQADFADGILTQKHSLPNLKCGRPTNQKPRLGELNFGAEIHCDGKILYFVQGIFSNHPFPDKADIGIAIKDSAGNFIVKENCAKELSAINTDALEYGPSVSTDLKELYFTRLQGTDFGIYVATRNSVSSPWNKGVRITSIKGNTTEAPCISYDGKWLYYHQKIDTTFHIFVVQRKE